MSSSETPIHQLGRPQQFSSETLFNIFHVIKQIFNTILHKHPTTKRTNLIQLVLFKRQLQKYHVSFARPRPLWTAVLVWLSTKEPVTGEYCSSCLSRETISPLLFNICPYIYILTMCIYNIHITVTHTISRIYTQYNVSYILWCRHDSSQMQVKCPGTFAVLQCRVLQGSIVLRSTWLWLHFSPRQKRPRPPWGDPGFNEQQLSTPSRWTNQVAL